MVTLNQFTSGLDTLFLFVRMNVASIGSLLTLVGLILAWVLPLQREQRQRERQDEISLRGLILYFRVLDEKSSHVLALFQEYTQENEKRISEKMSSPSRAEQDRYDELQTSLRVFDGENKENHAAIERLYCSSELNNTAKRSAIHAFIEYSKLSLPKTDVKHFKEYQSKISDVLACLAKGEG